MQGGWAYHEQNQQSFDADVCWKVRLVQMLRDQCDGKTS